MLQSCDKDVLTGQPSWLGNSIYDQLKEEGKAAILAQLRKLEKALSGYEDDIEEQVAEEA